MQLPLGVAVATLLLAPTSALAVLDVNAGPDALLECESEDGTEYTLNGTVPDIEGIEVSWETDPDVDLDGADTLTPTGVFPLGATVATLTATTPDDSGSDDTTVTVEDTLPPVVVARAEPRFLWPPNHEMKDVWVRLRIRDRCSDDDDFDVELISATSNEPDNSNGDGNTVNDIQDADIGTDDRHVRLRAERKGNGDGRIYTLVYRVTDADGNSTDAEARVFVPHDASDLRDLIDDMGGDRNDLEPICPRPEDAAEEFTDALPSPSDFPTERACQSGCSAWERGCGGIVRGAGQCVRAEWRSLMALDQLMCRQESSRVRMRDCLNQMRTSQRNFQSEQRGEASEAGEICREEGEACSHRCDRFFDAEDYED
jgi:hypothetical protein